MTLVAHELALVTLVECLFVVLAVWPVVFKGSLVSEDIGTHLAGVGILVTLAVLLHLVLLQLYLLDGQPTLITETRDYVGVILSVL